MATTVPTASRTGGDLSRFAKWQPPWFTPVVHSVATSAAAAVLLVAAGPAQGQVFNLSTGVNITGTASNNPDLAPRGQEQGDMWMVISPYFTVNSTSDGKFRLSGGGSLGASARLSLREDDTVSTFLRPVGSLNGTWEAIDNFFFVDVFAGVQSTLNDPFLATTDPTSPVNTTSSYQFGVTPYIRGQLAGNFDYEVRSANRWTDTWSDSPNFSGQYSATNTARIERTPQPLGGVFIFEQRLISSDVEDQSLLESQIARLSLRYALTNNLVVGARAGAERYNFTAAARDWKRYYGAEASWRPNPRTRVEGYWEDRVFGNSWRAALTYRRPRMAFNFASSRALSSTPEQFVTFPGLASLVALLDASLTTRIPDPVERQRAVSDLLKQTELPAELLTPTIIFSEGFSIQETNTGSVVMSGRRSTLGLTVFWTSTESRRGIVTALPVTSKTLQRGAELAFSRRLTPVTSLTATASWRNTQDRLDESRETTQRQLRLQTSRRFGERTSGTLGARYQWIESTVSNDATEAAVFFTLNYRFD